MQWLVGLLGIWYLLSPWIFKAASAAMWNGIIVGIIVAICAYMFQLRNHGKNGLAY